MDSAHAQMPFLLLVRGLFLVLAMVGAVVGLHYYIGVRLIAGVGLTGWPRSLAWAMVWGLFFSIPLGFAATRLFPRPVARAMSWVSHLWLGAFGLLLVAMAASEVLVLLLRPFFEGAPVRAYQSAGVLAAVVPALGLGFFTARSKAKVERVTVSLAGLGPQLEGLRIVQVSDVHIGETLDGAFLRRVVEQVNALDADVVAITGDLVDGSVRNLRSEVAVLAELKARWGVYFVTGNHEYYHGGPAWEAELRRLGVVVLHNEHRVLTRGGDRLVLAGVTDYDAGQFGEAHASRPDLALAGAPSGVPRVLLAHQPRSARAAAAHQVDLQLSGHTHGGQMFPWMYFVRLQQPVISGLATLHGVTVYTSRGTGYWGPPIRLGPTPEITELTLTRKMSPPS
ncbi:MAG: metallophosphoesterase [Myxococcota bacterium]